MNKLNKPRMNVADIIAVMGIVFGLLLFLVGLHIITINTTGDTNAVLNIVFTTFVGVFGGILIGLITLIIVKLLYWVVWSVQTPEWEKKRDKGG